MKKVLAVLFCLSFSLVFSQGPGGNPAMAKAMSEIKARVYGKLVDAKTGEPVQYAPVVVLWFNKDSLMGGALTSDNGEFNIDKLPSMGTFRLKATQIGYKPLITKIYIKIPDKLEQDLGDLRLETDEKFLNEVEVVTDKGNVSMSIDKRSYNVDKDLSVKGGTAADVMKNVPGLTVDAEGNVELRSQAPMIFVDGRPTNLTLQQIPADQIERVEVITNPSVKFDAGATGGILNIIMKKNLKPGYNGMVMTYIGTGDRYGGMANINLKEGKWNISGMYSYNQAINNTQGYTRRTQLDSTGGVLGYFNQDNETRFRNKFNFGKVGIDYSITNRNTISLNQMLMAGQFKTNDEQQFHILDKEGTSIIDGTRLNDQHAQFRNSNTQLLYKRTFPKQGKEFTADLNYNYNTSSNGYLFSTFSPTNTYQRNVGNSNASQYVFQMDFVNPLSETKKFEAGIKAFYKNSISSNNTTNAENTQDLFSRDTIMSNRYVIDDVVNAAYVNYSSQFTNGINYQAGLRFEQSYYKGNITDKGQSFFYNYPSSSDDLLKSLFPGIYFSKKLSANREWQLNFSRKIQRPNFFQLMPFVMFADRLNYRIGNPQLRPEFRNIAELNFNKTLTKGSYLGSLYGRIEEQPITDVAYPAIDQPEVLVNTTINGRNSFRYGTEQTFKHTFYKNLDVTLNANVFYIYIRGIIVSTEPEVKAQGFAFNTKAILSYKFPKQFTTQLNVNYESPRILLLGASLPVYSADISVNKMFGTKWTLNVTLSDIFNTRRMGAHYETPYYIQDLSRRRETRYLRFSVSYLFGKMDASIFKRGKQMRGTNDNQGSQDGLDFGR